MIPETDGAVSEADRVDRPIRVDIDEGICAGGQPVDRRAGGRIPSERLLVAVLDGHDLGTVANKSGPDAVTGSECDPGRSHGWSCPPAVVERSCRRSDDSTVGQEADRPAFARERDRDSDQ